jgi:hypothetical protein
MLVVKVWQFKLIGMNSGLTWEDLLSRRGRERIVRLEQDGARTPLALNVPSLCRGGTVEIGDDSRRLNRPGKTLYTPFGDLLFVDEERCQVQNEQHDGEESITTLKSAIYRIKEIVNIPPISFRQNREAHSWTVEDMISKHKEVKVELAYIGAEHISDMIVGKDVSFLYVAASIRNEAQECRFVIYKVQDEENDDDDDDNGDDEEGENGESLVKDLAQQAKVFYDLTCLFPPKISQCSMYGSALAIDHEGHVYATYPGGGLVVLNQNGELMASIQVMDIEMEKNTKQSIMTFIEPTALTIGNDGYLYMSTKTTVQRMKIKTKAMQQPTNLIVPKLQ